MTSTDTTQRPAYPAATGLPPAPAAQRPLPPAPGINGRARAGEQGSTGQVPRSRKLHAARHQLPG